MFFTVTAFSPAYPLAGAAALDADGASGAVFAAASSGSAALNAAGASAVTFGGASASSAAALSAAGTAAATFSGAAGGSAALNAAGASAATLIVEDATAPIAANYWRFYYWDCPGEDSLFGGSAFYWYDQNGVRLNENFETSALGTTVFFDEPGVPIGDMRCIFTSSLAGNNGQTVNLFDTQLTTDADWAASATSQPPNADLIWKLDFSARAPQIVAGWKWGGGHPSRTSPVGVKVEYSQNNTDWTLIKEFTGLTQPASETLSAMHVIQ